MEQALLGKDERSSVVAIKQKELELAAELSTAREVVERAVAEARQWAVSYLRQVEREARAFAATEYRAALEAIDVEAAAIRAEGDRAALTVAERGAPLLADAAGRILHIVLPGVTERRVLDPHGFPMEQEAQVSHA